MFPKGGKANAAAADHRALWQAVPVVLDRQFDHPAIKPKRDGQPGGSGMPRHIGKALLRTSINRDFHSLRGLRWKTLQIHIYRETVGQAALPDQPPQRVLGSKPLPFRRMQVMRDGSDLLQSLFGKNLQPTQCFLARSGQTADAVVQELQIDLDSGERLPGAGM